MIRFTIERPLNQHAYFHSDFQFSGWVISYNKIKGIKIYINDSLYLQIIPSIQRDDVLAHYSDYPKDQLPGFNENIEIKTLRIGLNEITIEITDQKNCVEYVSLTIERTIDAMEYHYYYIAARKYANKALKEKCNDKKYLNIIFYVVCELLEGLKDTLSSLKNQSYKNIDIRIVAYNKREQVKNYLSNSEYKELDILEKIIINDSGSNEYVSFIMPGEIMDHISVEQWVCEIQDQKPDLSYSDNDYYLPNGLHCSPDYKPDWSYNFQLSKDYIGGVYFIKKTEDAVRKINTSLDITLSAWRYDLLFKLLDNKVNIHHLTDVLWSSPFIEEDEIKRNEKINIALSHINKHEHKADVIINDESEAKIQWKLEATPKVSIIIPTTGRPNILIPCVSSIIDNTVYPNYELLFLDNGRGMYPDGINFLKEKGLKVIERNEPFNWSRLNNVGVKESDGEILLFLNDDIEVTSEDWLNELVRHSVRASIGCVGGLLLYPDGRIQHAGVFLVDHGGGARHLLHFVDPNKNVYQNLHKYVREVSANTGACLMVRREIFEQVNGFDEDLAIVGNDIDLCLRLSKEGYLNLWTPECSLIHHESISRKEVVYADDEKKMWERWEDTYLSGDPYYNPNLTLNDSNCELAPIKKLTYDALDVKKDHIGVNIIGYIKAEMGVGEGARGIARALSTTKIPFCILNYEQGNPSRMGDNEWDQKIVDSPKYEINILHINADLTPQAVNSLSSEYFNNKYTIGFWAWELPDFPDEWLESFSYVDEVWVPSIFVRDAVKKKSSVPVTVIPHPIEKINIPYLKREYFKLPIEVFLFLMMYDTYSIQERKNPKGCINAFKRAFKHNDVSVGLVIKVNNANEAELAELEQEVGEYKNIYIIAQTINRYEVDSLISCCDSFVSLHRSEGFGLVLAESMAMGKTVIATNWSGNVDFMKHDNSICIDYELKQLNRDYGPYKAYQHWAEPDLEQATHMMRKLVANPTYANKLGFMAKFFIEEKFSPSSVGKIMKKRIDQINAEHMKKLTAFVE